MFPVMDMPEEHVVVIPLHRQYIPKPRVMAQPDGDVLVPDIDKSVVCAVEWDYEIENLLILLDLALVMVAHNQIDLAIQALPVGTDKADIFNKRNEIP